ncbi:DUF975 family protein [Desulfosporosinus nitroreducens]|uniref:DUF975 family protein n=1 Tax=Desulfosporosinus nitroreducens TaxID=2018668 RepID=A0ABT8QSF1_9FIRM|nr:DUF975 family protein [Desulfosporosinus nitroreducens]MDO0823429.1 DUF975 family protein [Desulfosporosinus nitroreducens]
MPQESYDLKLRAREQLKGKWLQAGIVSFIVWLLTIAFTEGNVDMIHSVQFIWHNGELINVPATNNLTRLADLLSFILIGPITLGVSGYFLKLVRQEGPIIEDMFGGFKFFLKAFVLDLLMTIFIILWSLLLIIPGIIAALRYSMAYYIMIDNPQLSAFEALNRSKLMMVGFKSELFSFWLSYLGWFLLGVITLGIAFLWVTPYYETAKANFYQDLKDYL